MGKAKSSGSSLSLNEYREILDSEARQRVETQEATIKQLHSHIKAQDGLIENLRNDNLILRAELDEISVNPTVKGILRMFKPFL